MTTRRMAAQDLAFCCEGRMADVNSYRFLAGDLRDGEMLGIDTGDPNPTIRQIPAFIAKYRADAGARLAEPQLKPEAWWREEAGPAPFRAAAWRPLSPAEQPR